MPVIEDGMVADLRYPTASLPKSKPHGITTSADGRTLYVGCVGNGADGVVVAINLRTGAQTTVASGLQYVKHGMDIDGSGNVYYATGPNNASGGTMTLHSSGGGSVWTDTGLMGLCVDGSDVFYEWRPNQTSRLRKRALAGTVAWTVSPYSNTGDFNQYRGMDTTDSFLVAADIDDGRVVVHDKATGLGLRSADVWATAPTGVAAISDTEAYVLCTGGHVYRFNPTTASRTILSIGLPLTASGAQGYSNIHISNDGGMAFFVRGGWRADEANINPEDHALGLDVGVYAIGEITGGPTVGFIGFGVF